MSVQLRLPNINGSDKEQLAQIRSFLYQIIPELQFALNNIETLPSQNVTPTQYAKSLNVAQPASAQETFNSIKSLIIKSADIVDAYYEEINKKLEGLYVAESDFGEYAQKTSQEIEENSTSTTNKFANIQVIINEHDSDISSIDETVKTIEEDLSYALTDIVTINSNIEAIDENIASVEGNINELDTNLQEAKEELNEANASTNERIDDTNGSIAGLGEGLNDANSKIANVDEDLQESKTAINKSIQSVQEGVTEANTLIEDAKSQLQDSLDDLSVYVTGLNQAIIGVTAYLKTGLLYYTDAGIPVYGMEIGQTVKDEIAGEEVFNKYARFTSEKLSFYDNSGNEVAYISDKKLFIRIAEITVSFKIGGLIDLVMANGDVVTKWVGG